MCTLTFVTSAPATSQPTPTLALLILAIALALVLASALLPHLAAAAPLPDAHAVHSPRTQIVRQKRGGVKLPFRKQKLARRAAPEGNIAGGSIGLGDSQDL